MNLTVIVSSLIVVLLLAIEYLAGRLRKEKHKTEQVEAEKKTEVKNREISNTATEVVSDVAHKNSEVQGVTELAKEELKKSEDEKELWGKYNAKIKEWNDKK